MRLASLLLLLAMAAGQAACLNWKFWEMFYSQEKEQPTGLAKLQTWDRAEYEDILNDTKDYLSFMETKASHIVSMVRTLEDAGKGIYQVIRQIFAFNEGVNISDAIPKEDQTSIETQPIKTPVKNPDPKPKSDAAKTDEAKPAENPVEQPKPAEKPAATNETKTAAPAPTQPATSTAPAAQEKPHSATTAPPPAPAAPEPKPAPPAEQKPSAATAAPNQSSPAAAQPTATASPPPAGGGNPAASTAPTQPATATKPQPTTTTAEHKSIFHRFVQGSKHLVEGLIEHLYGRDPHAHRAAKAQRHSELAKMAQAYLSSPHAVASTVRPQHASHSQRRTASRPPHKSASHRRANPRHLLSEQSEQMASTWQSYFEVSEDMEAHVKHLQALITRIKAPGLELVAAFGAAPPTKGRPQD